MSSRKRSSWVPINQGDGDDPSANRNYYDVVEGVEDGWFTETEAMWPGQKFALALEEFSTQSVLYYQQSEFQSILVFKSAQYGNVLVLDGVIQMTARDEFAFHEMMVHLPLCSAQAATPLRVLIVGGGDGGVLRECVTQYDRQTVESITVVEIDPAVIDVAKRFLNAAPCFDDDRVTIVHADAAAFLADERQQTTSRYHVIIGDTSDPVGPAESLFQPAFYESMYAALAPGGLICVQAESFWIHLVLISDLISCCNDIFDTAEYATTMVPTYPCGQIGFLLARKQLRADRPCPSCRVPVRRPKHIAKLKWYSPEMHRAAFVLPPFVKEQMEGYTVDEGGAEDDIMMMNRRSLLNGASNEEREDSDDTDECFCKDVAALLPNRIKNVFTDEPNVYSGTADENNDCFLRVPFKCVIM